MRKNFFAAEGQPGLSASKAQRLCVWASKAMMEDEVQISSINFVTERESCVNNPRESICTVVGDTAYEFDHEIEHMVALTSLLSWLHEGINEKDHLNNKVQAFDLDSWAALKGLQVPEYPVRDSRVTPEDILEEWPADKVARYYKLKNTCAILHKICGKDSAYEIAFKRMLRALKNPRQKSWHGELLYVTEYDPSVDPQRVKLVFDRYQKQHSDAQSELNSLDYELEQAAKARNAASLDKYRKELSAYQVAVEQLRNDFEEWKAAELEKVQKLKIRIPDNLMSIFNEVRNFGTDSVDVE